MLGELLDFPILLYVTTADLDISTAIRDITTQFEGLGKAVQAAELSASVTYNFLQFNGSFILINRKETDLRLPRQNHRVKGQHRHCRSGCLG